MNYLTAMKNNKIKLFFLLLLLFTLGCKTQKPIVNEQVVKDSVYVYEQYTDTIITILPDSANIIALLECDSVGNVLLRELEQEQGKNIALSMKLKDNVISIDSRCDSLQHIIYKLRQIINEKQTTDQTQVVQVKYVPKYYKITSIGFWVLFVIELLRFVLWLAKKYYGRK